MITSACLGVALATSNPNLDQSYFAAAVLIISIAQQLVPNTSGQSELDLAQLITSSSLLTRIPPEGVGTTSPGKDSPSLKAFIELLLFEVSLISYFIPLISGIHFSCFVTAILMPLFYAHIKIP